MTMFEHNMDMKSDNIYQIVMDATGAGPLDGGCVMFARALQLVYGGEMMVLANIDDRADHAVLRLPNGHYMDADGIAEDEDAMVARFNDYEDASATHIRDFRKGDLLESPVDEQASAQVADILRRRLK